MGMSQRPVTQTTTQNTSTRMPSYVEDFQKYSLDKSRNVLDPYLNNQGYGVAGFNADQNAAFQGVRDMATAHGGGLDPNAYKDWLNPYAREVVDTTTQRMRDEADRSANALRARGAAGSAFGGMGARTAMGLAEVSKNSQAQIGQMVAQLMAQGYSQAQAQAVANRNVQQQSLQALMGIGSQQQQLEQQRLDVPMNAVKMMAGLTPQQYSTTGTMTGTQTMPNTAPGPLQQVLGVAGTIGGNMLAGPIGGAIGNQMTNWMTGRIPAMV
jgi:hypothetical protein